MKNVILFFSFLTVTLITNCKHHEDETYIRNLKSKLKKCVSQSSQENADCIIVFDSLTSYKWDKMYIFQSSTEKQTISKKLGFEWSGEDVDERYERFVFVKEDKVVEYIDYYTGEVPHLIFQESKVTKDYIYPSDRVFKIEKIYEYGGYFINIKPVDNLTSR